MSTADLVEKRKPLTRAQTIELSVRQNGRCGCGCGLKLDALREGVIDEHRVPLELLGSNDLSNRELWRKPCSTAKTRGDQKSIAKAKRLAGETCTGPTKAIPTHVNAWGPKGVRKLPSRPFPKSGDRAERVGEGSVRDARKSSSRRQSKSESQ